MAQTGQNIQSMRQQRGITVRQLQGMLGFTTPQAIYNWQHGVSLPTVDNLVALASIFAVSVETILEIRAAAGQ
ncbi:MAG: helix-turn-helix transcriptional regulator [Clostridia bacterium]|nr:helix-turn-helix transcriptional regulator [Clostridia bacterium]